MDRELPLRIVVLRPPPDVAIQVQRGRSALLPPHTVSTDGVSFEFVVRVRPDPAGGAARLLGEFAQGPPSGRFVYVNTGKRAGQSNTCWDRRAKVSLMTIRPAQIEKVLTQPGTVLEARVAGTGRDGGPACGSVPVLDPGWQVVRQSALTT